MAGEREGEREERNGWRKNGRGGEREGWVRNEGQWTGEREMVGMDSRRGSARADAGLARPRAEIPDPQRAQRSKRLDAPRGSPDSALSRALRTPRSVAAAGAGSAGLGSDSRSEGSGGTEDRRARDSPTTSAHVLTGDPAISRPTLWIDWFWRSRGSPLTWRKNAFRFYAPSSWNSLQATLKIDTLVSIGHFRSSLRETL
ncbi:unnamed protein product [Coregonus sp. 'balchen']|nr:unnamed protein product [Coregonus sp. 'balchen']